jgi:hypothetical protein
MFGGNRSRPALVAVAAIAALAIGGCGGDDGDSTAKGRDSVDFSAANEPPRTFVQRTANLLETSTDKDDCAGIADVNRHSLVQFECPSPRALSKSMKSFKIVGAEEYGTGAVVDYKSGGVKDGAAILMFVAPDRKWGISRFGVVTLPSTRSSDTGSREGYDRTVKAYLAAVRKRDCKAFQAVAFTTDDREGDVCETLFASTAELGKRLKKDPSAKPRYLGGNGTYGFYSIETEYPVPTLTNETISVIRTDGASKPYLVLDSAPSVTTEEQERVRRAYEYQQEGKDKTDDSPKPLPQNEDN